MAKRSVQQEDPWAGFVDVLSNVVMVVTFIVIILGIAMFALAQQVAETIVKDLLEKERVKLTEAVDSSTHACEVGSDGEYKVSVDRPMLVDDEIQGAVDLTIRRRLDVPDELAVAAMEETVATEGSRLITSTGALLTLTFDPEKYTIDDATKAAAEAAIAKVALSGTETLEVRGIAASRIGSITEARRVAFYRAMSVRNLLLGAGVPTERVRVRVRESVSPEDTDKIFVFADR